MFDPQKFSYMNLDRNIYGFNHSLEDWSEAEWTNALAGEAGEAANFGKKIIRCSGGVAILNKGQTKEQYVAKLAEELADVVIYADLCAAKIGVNLWEEIIKKFNKTTRELGLDETRFCYKDE